MTDGGFRLVRTPSVQQKKQISATMEGRGGPTWPHLPTTKTAQQYMDEWRQKTPRGQAGFPKTRHELPATSLQLAPSHPYCDRVTSGLEKEGGAQNF